MKKFFKFLSFALILFVVVLTFMDIVYTQVYDSHDSKRTKVQWVRSMDKVHYDYILIGSSRVIHHIDPEILNHKYGVNGVNLGIAGSGMVDMLLMAYQYLDDNSVDTLFVQIDYWINGSSPTPVIPFIRDECIYSALEKYSNNDLDLMYYFPFIRYMKFEPKLGFREVFGNIVKMKPSYTKSGFSPLPVTKFRRTGVDVKFENVKRELIAELVELCNTKHTHVCFFTAPIIGLDKPVEDTFNYLDDYTDFSMLISDTTLFKDNTHLNANGAKLFTEQFGEYYYGNKNK